ncbi:type II CRISPR RNA-guided endonuclease Cas9 [Planctomycetales bacterium ZRK34]|nr:type II CRISPR RNA-guided endonuclease Cas9 [Planctomycetales bacterium ZRK34]
MSDPTPILGLKLEAGTIGWALVDLNHRTIHAGVRVFPTGTEHTLTGKEKPRAETRRWARLDRRNRRRRKQRCKRLVRLLTQCGLWPKQRELQANLLAMDPYLLRRDALDGQLTPHQFGRILLHLAKRRGRLHASLKRHPATSETFHQLEIRVEETHARTIGEFFAWSRLHPHEPIRRRPVSRHMIESEFNEIWRAQKKYHRQLLSDHLYGRLHRVMFHQRPYRYPRQNVGWCDLEPNDRRAPRADPIAQRFAMLAKVNRIELAASNRKRRRLDSEERELLIDVLAKSRQVSISQLRLVLRLDDSVRVHLHNKDTDGLTGLTTDLTMMQPELFGDSWLIKSETEKEGIVHSLLTLNSDEICQWAENQLGLSRSSAKALSAIELQRGYVRYGRRAIERLLPFLEDGYPLRSSADQPGAIERAGYSGQKSTSVESLQTSQHKHPDPVVRTTQIELRKLLQAIRREYGGDFQVRLEIAEDMKVDRRGRERIAVRRRRIRQRRAQARKALEGVVDPVTVEQIDRYVLWIRQNGKCVYTGHDMDLRTAVDPQQSGIDHVLPFHESLDDSLANKVLCFRAASQAKGDRTVYQWQAESSPAMFRQICSRGEGLPYATYRRLKQKRGYPDYTIRKHLLDDHHVSKSMRDIIISCGFRDVESIKGRRQCRFDRMWQFDQCMPETPWPLDYREDYRHHAVDAIAITLFDRPHLLEWASGYPKPVTTELWPGFRSQLTKLLRDMHVSHKTQKKVGGALHEKTIYGETEEPGVYVVRRDVRLLSASLIKEIRDPSVREKIINHLIKHGIDPEKSRAIPTKVWDEPVWMNESMRIPIRKVRVLRRDATIRPIRGGTAHVKPGNLHHMCLFEMPDKRRAKCMTVSVDVLEAARRIQAGEEIVQHQHPDMPEARFIMSLSKGESVMIEWEGQEQLFRFITAASTIGRMYFVHHAFKGSWSDSRGRIGRGPNSLQARKVTIDRLGRVRRTAG